MIKRLSRLLCKIVDVNYVTAQRNISLSACFLDDSAKGTQIHKDEVPRVIVTKNKNITMIGINKPEIKNAVSAKTAAALCQAFTNFEADQTSPIAVLYGTGGSFCSGFDIREVTKNDQGVLTIGMLMNPEGSVGPTRRHIQKPVVCAINGYCIANGLELALMCDLRVMEESAVLGFFNRRFGVPVIDGGTARLPEIIGLSRSLDLILTGRRIHSEEALKMGIVSRIVPDGSALTKSLQLARQLAKFPKSALYHDRNSSYAAAFEATSFAQAIQNEIMYSSKEMITEMTEGVKWFQNNFKEESPDSWLKRDKSMADWDDERVAQAAAKNEEAKQEKERIKFENALRLQKGKQKLKDEKKKKK